jgi:hypothetical protein
MATVNFGSNPAGGVVPSVSSNHLVLAQIGPEQPVANPAAKRAPAARTVELKLGGDPVTAVPVGPPDNKGQTTYAVSWRGVTVLAPLTGQISAEQFKPGSWLKGALERALRGSRSGEATPATPAAQGQRGGPAPMLRIDLESPAINDSAARDRGMFGTKVFVPYVNPDYTSRHAVVVARELGYQVTMWTEPAPNWHTAPKAHAIVDLPNTREGGEAYARMNHQEVGYLGSQGTLKLPPGSSKEFKAGYQQVSRQMAAQDLVTIGSTLLGASTIPLRAPSVRSTRPGAGGSNQVWGEPTKVAPSGHIEVSNGGRPLPPVRMRKQPAVQGQSATAPPPAAVKRPLPPAGVGKKGDVIDVPAVTVPKQSAPPPPTAARPKPLPSTQIRQTPVAQPQPNQPVVRQAAEWPVKVNVGTTPSTRPTPTVADKRSSAPLTVVPQQTVQQTNKVPVAPQQPPQLQYSRLGNTAVVAPMQDAAGESKALGSLLIGKLNGQVPLVAVGDRYLPALIGDMPSNGNNRTVYSSSLAPYQNVNTVFYARPTEITNAQSINSFVQFAYQAPAGSTVVIPTSNGQTVASLGQLLRPDVNWMGASDNAFINNGSTRSDQQAALSAVTAVALPGDGPGAISTNVARPLNADDARWMSGQAGVTVPPGLVVSARFDAQGNLNRAAFQQQYAQSPDAANSSIRQLTAEREQGITQLQALANANNAGLTAQQFDAALSNPVQSRAMFGVDAATDGPQRRLPSEASPQVDYAPLGNVAVIGGTGRIGTAVTAQLGGEVPSLISVSRKSTQEELPPGATWAADLREHSGVDTVFITASADWRRENGKIIFDRSALLSDNIAILMDQLGSIPPGSTVISVMNPSNTMAWVIHTLRPDLKAYGHEGTDLGRLLARTPNAPGEQGILFGPHSPNLVAVDRNNNQQPVVPVVGQIYAQMSGNSATLTTASSAVSEAVNIRSGLSGSYAAPLSQDDAAWLTQMMRTHVSGWTQEIPKGLVVAAPMDPQTGAVNRVAVEGMFQRFSQDEREGKTYTALRPKPGSTEFQREEVRPTELLAGAMNELLTERNLAIQVIQQSLAKSHPELRDVPIEDLMRDPARLLELLAK